MIKDETWEARRRPEQRGRKRRRRKRRRFFSFLLALLLCAGWVWWQQNSLSTETLTVSGTPAGFHGYRIAIVSDVHGKEFGADNQRLLAFIQELRPDLIALVGDVIHKPEQLAMVPPLAKGLAAIAPTYYVTGNHEWAAKVVRTLEPMLEDCGVTVLSNRYVMLERGGDRLALLGAEDPNGYAGQKTIDQLAQEVRAAEGAETYQLLLSHRNNLYNKYAAAGVDLTLSGHAHGGFLRLPGTDGLIGHSPEGLKIFPSYTAGRYDLSHGTLAVSRGLGNQPPTFRLFNRPDVPLVILN